MNRFLKQLIDIDSEIYNRMGEASQKTIDFSQETVQQLDRDYEEEPIERDELGAINYQIGVLLEVWNPTLTYDIDVLGRFNTVVAEWYGDVEQVNKMAGIPLHKG